MPGRLAVDFGTSNTVIAYWDESRNDSTVLSVPDLGYSFQAGAEETPVIPSLIHYAADRRTWLGRQVMDQNLYDSHGTFRWMKRYISNQSRLKIRAGDGREISHYEAGSDFLSGILAVASAELGIGDEEVAFTMPVESYEHYENWLTEVVEKSGINRFRLIDEPSAAALGYGAHIQPGDVYLIFDFGGGTLDVAAVLISDEKEVARISGQDGRRCRVLGKAGADIGGMKIDQWLFQETLRLNGRSDSDDDVRRISRVLLVECEKAKEKLSLYENADVTAMNTETGAVISAEFTRGQFEELMDQHEMFSQIDRTIRRALNNARERGYSEENIKSVLMVGGSSLIPSVQKDLQRIFGRKRVMLQHPLDAVARGAAAFIPGVDFYDHIQHNYAIRHLNAMDGSYDYRAIVNQGTPYPTNEPVCRITVRASYDGQTQLGIAIYEIAEQHRRSMESNPIELVFDPSGAARVVAVTPDEDDRRTYFWMNEESPTFLTADPPAQKGEARFSVEFGLDGNKRLLITARDLKTDKLTHKDYPVVRLV